MRNNNRLLWLIVFVVFVLICAVGYTVFKNGTLNTWLTGLANIAPAAQTTTTVYTDTTTQGGESNRQADVPTTEAANTSGAAVEAATSGLTFIDWDPCTQGDNPDMQITYLVENGSPWESAFTGLDLNPKEVPAGLRYRTDAPEGSYSHAFTAVNDGFPAGNGFTFEIMGAEGTRFVSTAWTIWCPGLAGSAFKADHAGQSQVLDAKHLPNPHPTYGGMWLEIPDSGFLPFPGNVAPVAGNQAPGNTDASCAQPTDSALWKWEGNAWKYDSVESIDFTVPAEMDVHYFNGVTGETFKVTAGDQVVDANTVTAFCK